MAVFTTYDATGTGHNARDVSNFVTNVSPKDSPIFSLLASNKGMARLKENVTDTLTAANANNALVEGGSFTDDTLTTRSTESNYMQIFNKVINISGTQEEVIKYGGVTSEIGYQTTKKYTELATDVEKAIVVGTSASGTTAVARKLNGLLAKVSTNAITAATASSLWTGTADADYVAYEDKILDLLQSGYDNGVTFDYMAVGSTQKRRISHLTTKLTRNIAAESKMQILTINAYESDFGTVNIMLERYVPSNKILAFALDMWEISYLRPFKQAELAKTNDARQFAIVGELTLDGKTEKGVGSIVAGT